MSVDHLSVVVLGGGIIGVSSALCLLEHFPALDVTIIAAEFSPNTTADGAAGFWNPYLLGDVSQDKMRFWCSETFNFLQRLCCSEDASLCGVGFLSAYYLSQTMIEKPFYSGVFLEWKDLTTKQLEIFPEKYRHGVFFTTLFAECSKLLPYLMSRFRAKGGKVIKNRIHRLSELIGKCDILINCPGVEAAYLVPDPLVRPIRGQVIRVKAPWIKHAVIDEDFHILPNSETVVCGGTHQVGDWNRNIDPNDRKRIWEGCCALVPSLKNAEIVKEWVGLRPGRSRPRLEFETIAEDGKKLKVIHNYGHGGSGITLFWGCAIDVLHLFQKNFPSKTEKFSAKL